jgi:hypothetical protein
VKEEKAASDDSAPSQRFLRRLLALLLHIFDTGARAIVIVVKLVQCSKITTEAQSERLCVCDIVLESRRLFSTALII